MQNAGVPGRQPVASRLCQPTIARLSQHEHKEARNNQLPVMQPRPASHCENKSCTCKSQNADLLAIVGPADNLRRPGCASPGFAQLS